MFLLISNHVYSHGKKFPQCNLVYIGTYSHFHMQHFGRIQYDLSKKNVMLTIVAWPYSHPFFGL